MEAFSALGWTLALIVVTFCKGNYFYGQFTVTFPFTRASVNAALASILEVLCLDTIRAIIKWFTKKDKSDTNGLHLVTGSYATNDRTAVDSFQADNLMHESKIKVDNVVV